MKQASVIDFPGVARIIGYSLATVALLVAVALFLLGLMLPAVGFFVGKLAVPLAGGLALAWIAGLSRILVRRMHFVSQQEHAP